MPDREQDTLTAIYNRLRRKREELLQEAERLADQMRSTQELAKTLGGTPPTPKSTLVDRKSSPAQQPKEKVPVTKLLDEFIRDEALPRQFTAPQLVQYINSRGYYGENLYSSAFETLSRKVKKHELEKLDNKFVVPTKGAPHGLSSKVPNNDNSHGGGSDGTS